MLVRLRKLTLEDELDNCMTELSMAVCEDVWWGGDAKLLHICICKVIRKLWRSESDQAMLCNCSRSLYLGKISKVTGWEL